MPQRRQHKEITSFLAQHSDKIADSSLFRNSFVNISSEKGTPTVVSMHALFKDVYLQKFREIDASGDYSLLKILWKASNRYKYERSKS